MPEETGRAAGIADDNRLEKDYLISVENRDTAPYSLRAPALLSARSGGGRDNEAGQEDDNMSTTQATRVFARVAETESFHCVAREAKVSNAPVSRAIALLETHFGTGLINRTTREISLTDAEAHYLERCRAILKELNHLKSTISSTEAGPGGTLRVVASGALLSLTLAQLVAGFCKRYRSVIVGLTLIEVEVGFGRGGNGVGIVTGATVSAASFGQGFK
jgi:DNA-binding transcriptional LysR family regulator